MTDLPDGWEWTTLGEIAEAQPGFASGKHNRSGEGVLHLRPMNITRSGAIDVTDARYVHDSTDRRVVRNDVLFNNTNSPDLVGKSAVVNTADPVGFSNHMTRLRIRLGIESTFVACQLHALWKNGYFKTVMSNHVNQASVSTKVLVQTPLVLPPLVEQRRIVVALEGHLSRVEAGTRQLINSKVRIDSFRDRVLAAVSHGRLRKDSSSGAAPDPAYAGVVDGDLPSVPATWEWRRLEDIAEVVGGVTKDSKKQSDPSFPEVPYLRVANVQRGKLDLSDVARIRVDPDKAEKLELKEGDILLNEGGDRDKLGRGWIWEGQIDQCIHQNHVFRVRIKDVLLHPKLFAWHANGFGKGWFFANGKQSVNLASISLTKIKRFPVPVPPREEQEEIVKAAEKYLSSFDESEQLLLSAASRAERLRRSLLREAFAGRLVEQDPNDEPASVLLGRIRAECASASRVRRPRKQRAAKNRPAQDEPPREIDPDRPPPESVGPGTQGALDL